MYFDRCVELMSARFNRLLKTREFGRKDTFTKTGITRSHAKPDHTSKSKYMTESVYLLRLISNIHPSRTICRAKKVGARALNVKVKKFNQARVNGGSNYDSLNNFILKEIKV